MAFMTACAGMFPLVLEAIVVSGLWFFDVLMGFFLLICFCASVEGAC